MLRRLVMLSAWVLVFVAATSSAQNASFQANPVTLWSQYGSSNQHIKADLNGDGVEDFISILTPSFNAGCSGSFAVTLSNGDGSYQAPVCYTIPGGNAQFVAAADFLGSGNVQVVVLSDDRILYLFQNTGAGVLRYHSGSAIGVGDPVGLTVANLDPDGHPDLVYDLSSPNGTADLLVVMWNDGTGSFNPGVETSFSFQNPGALSIGDFDDDGKVDLLVSATAGGGNLVLYGNGHGGFTPGATLGKGPELGYGTGDLNNDGTMDLIGTPFATTVGQSTTYYKYLDLEFGHAGRAFTSQKINLKSCTPDSAPPVVTDVNGDGINDIVVIEAADCTGALPWTLDVLPGLGNGAFGPEQAVHTSSDLMSEPHVLRANRDTRPDLYVFSQPLVGTGSDLLLLNTTAGGNFPRCNPPANTAIGINVCAPTSTTGVSSPVNFSFGASNQLPGRDFEIWVDGKKVADQLAHAFSNYDFADASVPLGNGTHMIDLFAKSWDSSHQHVSFPLTVGSNTCPAPPQGTQGINVCSPINSSTVSSPVTAYAHGAISGSIVRMEVWVDGVKRWTTFASDTLQTQVALSPGTHDFTYYLVNAAGEVLRADARVTVQ
ncbi:VCBS repeat-containing protein [Acidobacteria bacterium AB60]|nr:VCBS repeat-containing protein [Acidobacteria bacterium AB60]